jgi:hypothetical protein
MGQSKNPVRMRDGVFIVWHHGNPISGWVRMAMVTIAVSLTAKQGESQPGPLRPTMIGFWTSGAVAGAMVLGVLLSEVEKATRIVTRRLQ